MQRPSFGQEPAAVAQEVMLLLARVAEGAHAQPVAVPRAFECKTCRRRFTSFQALGGHRASHKRPRGNAALAPAPAQARRRRRHGCAVCGLEFALGQALGGHMRRHRAGAGAGAEEDETSARGAADEEREQQQQRGGEISETTRPGMLLGLDLNAAPPSDGAGTPQLLRLWV